MLLFAMVAIITVADHDRRSKMLREQVLTAAQNVKEGYHPRKLFELLLNTAQLEYILSQVNRCSRLPGLVTMEQDVLN